MIRPRSTTLDDISAIGFVNEYAKDKDGAVDLGVVRQIHRTIFADAIPEIAGEFRGTGEDMKKLHAITPPPGSQVAGLMLEFGRELDERLRSLPPTPRTRNRATYRKWVYRVVEVAAWAQHKIAAIHRFSNGNGRTARLFTNLILQRHGLTGSRIKFEQGDKPKYLSALAQIDTASDYGPLIDIVLHAMEDQYRTIIKQRKNAMRNGGTN